MRTVDFTIYGEPASKANSRRLVKMGNRIIPIKSQKALNYVKTFHEQCPRLSPMMEGDLQVSITIYYASRRPDLDESVILDAMQGLIYENDRAVKRKIIQWGLDKTNPRSVITITELEEPAERNASKKKGKE